MGQGVGEQEKRGRGTRKEQEARQKVQNTINDK